MPSQSVSFSDDGYYKILDEKPEDSNFSEFVEDMALKGIEKKKEEVEDGKEEVTTEEY